jgi:hypothetical protein
MENYLTFLEISETVQFLILVTFKSALEIAIQCKKQKLSHRSIPQGFLIPHWGCRGLLRPVQRPPDTSKYTFILGSHYLQIW